VEAHAAQARRRRLSLFNLERPPPPSLQASPSSSRSLRDDHARDTLSGTVPADAAAMAAGSGHGHGGAASARRQTAARLRRESIARLQMNWSSSYGGGSDDGDDGGSSAAAGAGRTHSAGSAASSLPWSSDELSDDVRGGGEPVVVELCPRTLSPVIQMDAVVRAGTAAAVPPTTIHTERTAPPSTPPPAHSCCRTALCPPSLSLSLSLYLSLSMSASLPACLSRQPAASWQLTAQLYIYARR
jgi:hypothetical protein